MKKYLCLRNEVAYIAHVTGISEADIMKYFIARIEFFSNEEHFIDAETKFISGEMYINAQCLCEYIAANTGLSFDTVETIDYAYFLYLLKRENSQLALQNTDADPVAQKKSLADKRDQALFGEPFDEALYQDGKRYFDGLNKDALNYLLEQGLIDRGDYFFNSPSVSDFMDFLEKYPKTTLHGFADCNKRFGREIVITGCSYHGKLTKQFIIDFCDAFRFADEFNLSDFCCSCTFD